MSEELTSALKDVGLNANLRPNSLDIRGQQPNLFPSDAFVFDDPNRTDAPILSMKDPWTIDVGEIKFTSLEAYTQDMIHTASIVAEANSLSIQNNSGEISISADTIDIIARELNLEGETVNIKADKLVIYNPTDETETEQLSEVMKIQDGDIYFGDYEDNLGNGAVGMKWDQSAGEFFIKGDLNVTSGDRTIDVGSNGIKALDADSNIIHDLPDAASSSEYFYMGHYYSLSNTTNHYIGLISDATNAWVTFTTSDLGVSNIRGVRVQVTINDMLSNDGYYNLMQYRRISDDGGYPEQVGTSMLFAISDDSVVSDHSNHFVLDIPVDSNRQFQARKFNALGGSISIRQVGFWA